MIHQYFHLYNRGVEKRSIFSSDKDRHRFLQTIRITRLLKSPKLSLYLNQLKSNDEDRDRDVEKIFGPPYITIIAYCLMPNHYHLQVKEEMQDGVVKFTKRLGDSYTKYFNTKNNRTGRLFESACKTIRIESNEQLLHLSRYIHTNPANSSKTNLNPKELREYPFSSLRIYLGKNKEPFCNPDEVMNNFKSSDSYWEFVKASIGHSEEQLPQKLQVD